MSCQKSCQPVNDNEIIQRPNYLIIVVLYILLAIILGSLILY